ncbi:MULTISPECIES: 3-deoxy-D-manno-octulosonic acid transferase [Halocynthiibacter]|uniref:3-deoxy-D-manno-octulosonic acid transferase n=1 Tax=Halocynthiibacter halioticoli TaxID=2986804 RepID=A0AAE3LTM9_9RHOB|nr:MULTISPECIES: glycosyltransferase N-terminal domain-containing protein [Halocynthiibacter]MCV6825386.1 3-deoxy-D-manno-octulosonic acid transferase [Halocynthiibacter halioticoli]MCW4058387.1 3-deoxy-D-manno-octulosonic acid transferase [Halocynthiibacter sp. SDUM655004]
MLLRLYLGFAALNAPLWRMILRKRLKMGKEDPARMAEKLGDNLATRPAGPVVWVHGVSVGESLSLLTLLKELGEARPDVSFVLTTNTRTSADMLAKIDLPPRVIHQYQPADTTSAVRKFLAHWQPDLAVFSELDMWPCLLWETHKSSVPMFLINARMSDRSMHKRRFGRGLYRSLVSMFDMIFCQEDVSRANFITLGSAPEKTIVTGPLKVASEPLPDNEQERQKLGEAIGNRPYWLAASTHHSEEDRIFEAHQIARKTLPDLLLVIAPRHPKDSEQTRAKCLGYFSRIARRSKGEAIQPDTEVYIADTLGELGLFFRLSPVSFIGHSLPSVGAPLPGKNPYEAITLGSVVIHGPEYSDFTYIYDTLHGNGATIKIETERELASAVINAQDPTWRAPYQSAGEMAMTNAKSALTVPRDHILSALPVA